MAEIPRLWARRSERDTDSRSPFRPGDKVDDRYLIDGYIARGGMSVVYRAIDTRLDQPVALKVLRSDLAARDEFREGFVSEAKTVANLRGPGIVTVSDQGMWKGEAFLVMELVAGGTVRELLAERGPMPPYAAVAILRPCLEALAVAHASGFVHRDIKPENILIGQDGVVKVVDFGLVRAVNSDDKEGYLVGTAAYLAPEQVTGAPITPRCDVYSAGLVLYELLVGYPPFGMEATREVADRRLHADVPRASEQRPGIPREFDEIIATATTRDPQLRYVDAKAMCMALDHVAATLHLPHYVAPTPQESAEQTAAQTALSAITIRPSGDDKGLGNLTTQVMGDEAAGATAVLGAATAATSVLGAQPAREVEDRESTDGTAETEILSDDTTAERTQVIEQPEIAATQIVEKDYSDYESEDFLFPGDEEDEEPLTPEEEHALRMAARPRVWPMLVWLLALLLAMGGIGTAFRSVGNALLPPASPSYIQVEPGVVLP